MRSVIHGFSVPRYIFPRYFKIIIMIPKTYFCFANMSDPTDPPTTWWVCAIFKLVGGWGNWGPEGYLAQGHTGCDDGAGFEPRPVGAESLCFYNSTSCLDECVYVLSQSVVSDSLWPLGLLAHQVLLFMDFYSGKNTGVDHHFLL